MMVDPLGLCASDSERSGQIPAAALACQASGRMDSYQSGRRLDGDLSGLRPNTGKTIERQPPLAKIS